MSENFQPSFEYGEGTGHVAGSETSKRHEQYEKEKAPTLQKQILGIIHAAGTIGCTSEEVEIWTERKHQSVSSSIRNLELADRLVKTTRIRNNQHAYVSKEVAGLLLLKDLLPPNPRRVSWKKKYEELLSKIEEVNFIEELQEIIWKENGYMENDPTSNVLTCPHCGNKVTVSHFDWTALVCPNCKAEVEKNEWIDS